MGLTEEGPGKLAALRKCAHHNCTCTVEDGEEYCSDYCLESMGAEASADEDDDEACGCGHAECTSKEAIAPIAPFPT